MRWKMFKTVSWYVDIMKKSSYVVIVIYQIEIMNLYLKQFINLFIKTKRFSSGN